MKKLIFLLALVLLSGVALTSCLDDDDNDQRVQMASTMYNRALNADGTTQFSQALYQITVRYKAGTIEVTGAATVGNDTHTFTTPEMELQSSASNGGSTYSFSTATATCNTATVTNLRGTFDMNKGVLYVTYQLNGTTVHSTSAVSFPYTSATVTDSTGASFTTPNMSFFFTISGNKGQMAINNYTIEKGPATQASTVNYNGLNVTVNNAGYEFTANELKATDTDRETFRLTNFHAVVSNQGLLLNASYDCSGKHVTVTGHTFNTAD